MSGFCIAYRVQDTPDRGRGVFAAEPVRAGGMVWRHQPGRYSVLDEAGLRALVQGCSQAEAVYELTHVFGLADLPGLIIRVEDDGALINHARDANTATNLAIPMRAVLDPAAEDYLAIATRALLEDRFALIATRDIAAGEELTNDYLTETYEPDFYHALCLDYGVEEAYLND